MIQIDGPLAYSITYLFLGLLLLVVGYTIKYFSERKDAKKGVGE